MSRKVLFRVRTRARVVRGLYFYIGFPTSERYRSTLSLKYTLYGPLVLYIVTLAVCTIPLRLAPPHHHLSITHRSHNYRTAWITEMVHKRQLDGI